MSTRNLDSLFEPSSVVVIGASHRPGRVGSVVWRNMLASDYRGTVYAVNPKHKYLDGHPVQAKLADLPKAPDLALICSPPTTVTGVIRELAAMGTKAAVILTPGINLNQMQAALNEARSTLLRILGPDSIGLLSPHRGLNASAAHMGAAAGGLAFVSQSAGLVTAMLDWAKGRHIGFSHVVSLGERADVDFGDMLDYLASDPKTRAIMLYMEAMEAPRKFMSAARAAARNKLVIVVRGGRSAEGRRTAEWHTRALAGADLVFDAAIRRAGMLRVDSLHEMFMAAETLARFRGNTGDRLAIVTNGGGVGMLAADAADRAGVELAELRSATFDRLSDLLPTRSEAHPIDLGGEATPAQYVQTLQALSEDPGVGATLLIHAPSAQVQALDVAEAVLPLATGNPPKLLTCWLGDGAVASARQRLRVAGVPSYFTPEEAVRAFGMGLRYRRNQDELLEAPGSHGSAHAADIAKARNTVRCALLQGQTVLSEPQAMSVLQAYGIPVVQTRQVVASADAAAEAAAALGFPVVLKILSAEIAHKSDVGGVALNLPDTQAVTQAATTMLERVRHQRPDVRPSGFIVQTMVRRQHAHEVIVGASIDPNFGPMVLFGAGGTGVELIADRAVGLPPLNAPLAWSMIQRTHVAKNFTAWRDHPAADTQALSKVLVSVSQMLADLPELAELDINPLLVNHEGVIALDARIRLDAQAPGGADHFAIRPYPDHLVEQRQWRGRHLTLRPIRPEDEEQHRYFLRRIDPEDIRMRVFYSRRSIERSELARLTQIDYAREMAFIATATVSDPDGVTSEETLGAVRALTDPDNDSAEFAILVRSDLKGSGLGRLLMNKLIEYLRSQGTRQIIATTLTDNRTMRAFMRSFGFVESPFELGDDTVDTRLTL